MATKRVVVDLFYDEILAVLSLAPNLLVDRLGPRTDCQMMLDDLTGNSREIRRIPGKNISVFPKESDEFRLLLTGEMIPDGDETSWFIP